MIRTISTFGVVVAAIAAASAQEIEIEHWTHDGCVIGGQAALPVYALTGGRARVEAGQYRNCNSIIDSSIRSCEQAIRLPQGWPNEEHPECLAFLESEVHGCVGHYESQRSKCEPVDGHGSKTYSDGSRYEGDLVDGAAHGLGVMTWTDGSRYEGDFVDGAAHGQGAKTWPNGDRY